MKRKLKEEFELNCSLSQNSTPEREMNPVLNDLIEHLVMNTKSIGFAK